MLYVAYGADEHLLQKNKIKKRSRPSTCSRARRKQLMRVRLKSMAHAINARMYYYGDLAVLKGEHRQRFWKFTEECIKVQNTFLIQINSICHKPPISYFAIIVLPFWHPISQATLISCTIKKNYTCITNTQHKYCASIFS